MPNDTSYFTPQSLLHFQAIQILQALSKNEGKLYFFLAASNLETYAAQVL